MIRISVRVRVTIRARIMYKHKVIFGIRARIITTHGTILLNTLLEQTWR